MVVAVRGQEAQEEQEEQEEEEEQELAERQVGVGGQAGVELVVVLLLLGEAEEATRRRA